MKRNVLFITCDQLRKDALGLYGNEVIHTPNLDALFRNAAVFDQMYCASPICAPNRGAIATGKWPTVNGLVANGYILPKNSVTMPEVFRRNGYRTYGIGKMHFEGQWENDFDPVTGKGALNPQPRPQELPYYGFETCWMTEDSREGPYADYLRQRGYDPFEEVHSCVMEKNQEAITSIYPKEVSQTHWITDQALRELESLHQNKSNQPFFMWLSYVDPHHPFNPCSPYAEMYCPSDMPLPLFEEGENEARPDAVRMNAFGWDAHTPGSLGGGWNFDPSQFSDSRWQEIKAAYYGMITQIDDNIGRVVELLKKNGMFENTIFVFTADHGEILGDHHLIMKGYDFDSVSNPPFMVRTPEMTQRKDIPILCRSLEIMPTVLDLAGLPVPENLNGVSLLPQIQGDSQEIFPYIHINEVPGSRGSAAWVSIRSQQYRMTVYPNETCRKSHMTGELYDRKKDPNEFHNLWYNAAFADIKEQLQAELMMQLKDEYSADYHKSFPV